MDINELKHKLSLLADTYWVDISLHLEDGSHTWYAVASSKQAHNCSITTKSYSDLEDVIDVLEVNLRSKHA